MKSKRNTLSTLHAIFTHFTNTYSRTFDDLSTDQRSRRSPTSSSQPPTPRMRRCLHVVVVVRMSPPHFSPDTAAVSLTPPFPVLAPPFRLITPTASLDPLSACVCSKGTSLPRIILVVPHSPRLHAFSLNPLVSARSAPSAPSSSTDCLFSHDHRASALKTMSSLAASDRFLLDGRSNRLYRHLDLLFSPARV